MITILHLSDLHRSATEPINNDTLLSSLLADQDRYMLETPPISKPDIAIVSGDIIQGVGLGDENFEAELESQYAAAHDFLDRLADRFFNGDRSRIVIVPGNHDICWNTALAAMNLLEKEDEPKKIGPSLFRPSSTYRWKWSDRRIYQITRQDIYKNRLRSYWKFIESFYEPCSLKHPIMQDRGYNFFEFDNGKIVVAAFDSIYGNDCFCNHGSIKEGSIGACSLEMRDFPLKPLLAIGTWHHSIQGPPHRDDYMDVSTVHEMIGIGFKLGLHGHQHQADAAAYNIHLPEAKSMAIISAGSLCAGAYELPRGTNRQYNIIRINDDYSGARIHVREMAQGNQFGKCRQGLFSPDGFIDISWLHSSDDFDQNKQNIALFAQNTILLAEEALMNGDGNTAVSLLRPIEKVAESHARRLYATALQQEKRWGELAKFFAEPLNVQEFVILIKALEESKQIDVAEQMINRSIEFGVDAGTQAALKSKIELKKMLEKK